LKKGEDGEEFGKGRNYFQNPPVSPFTTSPLSPPFNPPSSPFEKGGIERGFRRGCKGRLKSLLHLPLEKGETTLNPP